MLRIVSRASRIKVAYKYHFISMFREQLLYYMRKPTMIMNITDIISLKNLHKIMHTYISRLLDTRNFISVELTYPYGPPIRIPSTAKMTEN